MSDQSQSHTHPYELEVGLVPSSSSQFQWLIRRGGKALERSDRSYTTEEEARRRGAKAVERLLGGFER